MNGLIGELFGVGAIGLIVFAVLWAVDAFEPADARSRRLAAEALAAAEPVPVARPVLIVD